MCAFVCVCVCVCVYNVYKKVRKSEEDRKFFFNFMELVNAIIVADKPIVCRVGPGKRWCCSSRPKAVWGWLSSSSGTSVFFLLKPSTDSMRPTHIREDNLLYSKSIKLMFRSDQSLSRVRLFATPRIAARQASLSITNSQSWLRLTSIESVIPSSHLILCRPLLLLTPVPPSISLFQWVNSSHEMAKVMEFQL